MADSSVNYQCPSCGGRLMFSGSTGKLVCEFCDSSFEVAEIEALYAEKQAKADEKAEANAAKEAERAAEEAAFAEAAGEEVPQKEQRQAKEDPIDEFLSRAPWNEADSNAVASFTCPSCGAGLLLDASTAASSCPYCGNPTVIPGSLAGEHKPDLVIPFKIEKKKAISALASHYSGKLLLPKAFAGQNHIEHIQGVYVPFWLFDGTADGDATYEGQDSRTYRSGDYEVTETKHYDVSRSGKVDFTRVPEDASSKMPDAHMDAIAPYDYSELKPFSVAYLPGYVAERYDVEAEDVRDLAEGRMEQSLSDALLASVTGYDSVSKRSEDIRIEHTGLSYALFPVWMLHTTWEGKDFLFAMNGQTGKFIGDLPIDGGKSAIWFIGTLLITGALMYFIMGRGENGLTGSTIAIIIGVALAVAIVVQLVLRSSMRSAHIATKADEYLDRETLDIYRKNDRYTHTTTSRRKIEKDN